MFGRRRLLFTYQYTLASFSTWGFIASGRMWLKEEHIFLQPCNVMNLNKQPILIPEDELKARFQWIAKHTVCTMKSRWNSKYLRNRETSTLFKQQLRQVPFVQTCQNHFFLPGHNNTPRFPSLHPKPKQKTLPETNSSPLKINGWKVGRSDFLFGMPIFVGRLSVLGRILPTKMVEEMWIFFHILIEFSPDWPI